MSVFKHKLNSSQTQLLIIIGFLIVGTILRLIWAMDMEWKNEEIWTFEQARKIATGEIPLPTIGILSSIGIPQGGLSMWCFAAIASFSEDPVAMVRWIGGMNSLVLWLFFAFILRQIAANERESWLWGIAIASVNPFAILFSRKIWIPDILIPFCFLSFIGHWFRRKFLGSFLWGCFTLLSGQIHLGGFVFTAGFFLWTIWHDYRQRTLQKIAWLGWLCGSFVASIPMFFWLVEALPQWQGARSSIVGLLIPKFYSQWLTTALGVNMSYSLQDVFWSDFLKEPIAFGFPSYLMVVAHLFLVGIGLYPFYRWLRKSRRFSWRKMIPQQEDWQLLFYLKAMGLGVGGTFTLSAINFVPYYIPVVLPFPFIWLARLYEKRIKMLLAIVLVQLLISLTFLTFIHYTGGSENSDYGLTYRTQLMLKE
ncbi:MAG: hypothetical protein AAGA60_19450 [Cyanobacteria bacterium P01_E01_bin.42]